MSNPNNGDFAEYFYTNVESFGFKDIRISNSKKLRVDALLAISKFQDFCDANNLSFEYYPLYISLLEDGALEVPIVFSSEKKGYSVFFIYTEDDAKKYNDAIIKIKQTRYPNAIYFSAFDITNITNTEQSTRTLQLADLRIEKEALLNEEYAMWWTTEDETTFSDSETRDVLDSLYEIQKDYESVYTGYLLHQIGISDEFGRAMLPNIERALIVQAPENKNLLLILSREKGIRFLFPVNSTSRFYREQFLSAIRVNFLTLRLTLQQQQIPKDEPMELNGTEWFRLMVKATEENEKNGQLIKSIGGWGMQEEQSYGVN